MGVDGDMAPQFLNRVAGATALLDGARAAMRLPNTSLDPHGPVAFWGWLAGGHASLAAAELAGTYAPELHIVGTYANAAATDLAATLPAIDGNFLAGSLGWVLKGLQEAYPAAGQAISDTLTPRGAEMLANTSRQCMMQTGTDYAFRHIHRVQRRYLRDSPNRSHEESFGCQRIGNGTPTGPVYFSHNRWDPFNPYASAVQTAKD